MSEQSIFLAVLDISDPTEREAYLAAACGGNESLRKEIEALLASHERPGPFLETPAVAQIADTGGEETRTVVPGVDPDFAETRAPDSVGGSTEEDVLAFLQPPTRPSSLGRLKHYEVQEVLGRGGFGTVLKAFDDRLHRVVAIKVMAPQLAASGAARARFLREGRSAAAVRDEHVVNVYAVSEDDEPIPYLVMEFVSGQTLQQKLDKAGPLPVAEVLRIGGQIARGLSAAHATGLIHRDIKPANILLENGVERVKITDFGLARAADDASISQSGVVAGTPQYMAPEQARGEAIDHRSDLFSLGSVLYSMCTGRPPFRAETTLAVLKRVCEDDPRPVREVNPQVPQWLADVVAKLHAKNPADRFQSAKEVADLLAQYLTELQMHGTVTPASYVRPVTLEPRLQLGWPVIVAATLLLPLPSTLLLQWHSGTVSNWMALAASVLLGVLGAVLGVAVSQKLGWLEQGTPSPVPPGTSPFAGRSPRWWELLTVGLKGRGKWVALGVLAFGLLFGFAFAPAVLYVTNRGHLSFEAPDTLTRVTVRRDEKPVEEWWPAFSYPTMGLPAGHYRLEATCAPGYEVAEWKLKGSFAQTGWADTRHGQVCDVEVARGGRVAVTVVTRPIPAKPSPAVSDKDGWVQLFNGKDLTGWKYHPDQPGDWKVENRALLGSGRTSNLFSERGDYENFHLRFEAKINAWLDAQTGAWGRSGLFLRAPFAVKNGSGDPLGYDLVISARKGTLLVGNDAFVGGRLDAVPMPPDTWFTGEVIATGNRVVVKVNGEVTSDFTDSHHTYPKGHLALQVWQPQIVVQFRKIEIKELPASVPATPAAPSPAVAPFDAAKAKEHQDVWAKHLGVPVEQTNIVGMKLRLIPPGEFTMGSSKAEIDWLLTQAPDLKDAEGFIKDWVRKEGPERRVTIREPFLLGAHEVTVGQFREFVKATGYKTDGEKAGGGFVWNTLAKEWERNPGQVWSSLEVSGGENHPVKFVTSDDIRAFCDWLGKQDGRKYAIPTEEQWEYACRAGTTARWSFGDDPIAMQKYGWTAPHASGKHHPVGRLAANPFGLFDMHGNVGELVITAQGEEYQRGGTAGESPQRARSASRVPVHHDLDPIWTRGFRVVVVGDLKPKAPAGNPPPDAEKALREVVAAKTRVRDTKKLQFEAGRINKIEFANAEADLIEARIKLAEAERKFDAAIAELEELVRKRHIQRLLTATQVDLGVELPVALDEADARLALAKKRLALLRPPTPPGAVVPFDAKQADAHQQAWAKRLGVKVEFDDNKVAMTFRLIPPGDFQMGAKASEIADDVDRAQTNKGPGWQLLLRAVRSETPQHPVRITRPFAIGKYEVTVGQFKQFVEATKYQTAAEKGEGWGFKDGALIRAAGFNWKNVGYEQSEQAPVWNVTRDDAIAFCVWFSKQEGRTFRLPTEAEWEWACRAGTSTRTFWDGVRPADALPYAWGSNKSGHRPQQVGLLKPNAFGLYDICGNVWEWCSDWYGVSYYKEAAKNPLLADPTGADKPDGGPLTQHYVQRGGGVNGGHYGMSSTARSAPEQKIVGFRVVCELTDTAKLPPPEPKKPQLTEVAPPPRAKP